MSERPELYPDDEDNRALEANVHPRDWRNPEPAQRYNLVVIGAGTAGLVTAAGAAGLGARVALIERNWLGGDCLNVGCVPSKVLLRSARAMGDIRDAGELGVRVPPGSQADFAAVMQRMRRIRRRISAMDSAQRFRDLGVDVFFGSARFAGGDRVEVRVGEPHGDRSLRFKRAVIATGARPIVPAIPGLSEAGFLTNETVFSLTTLPRRMVVLGAGPIGCELAQAFQRLGSQVTLVEVGSQFLPREDPDAAAILLASLRRDGVDVRLETTLSEVAASPLPRSESPAGSGDSPDSADADGHGAKRVTLDRGGKSETLTVDEILVGVGRAPNVENLGLAEVGIETDRRGVVVNDRLQTANPRVYAAGDVCLSYKFTHAADFSARTVIQNALFFGRSRASALTIPWCTYSEPEIAHVGLYEREAAAAGFEIDTFVRQLAEVDRAIAEDDEEGFVKIHVKRGTDKIVGATIVARNAGDMISEVSVAMAGKVGLSRLASVIHPYPTQAEAIRQIGDAYRRTRLTPLVARVLRAFLALTR